MNLLPPSYSMLKVYTKVGDVLFNGFMGEGGYQDFNRYYLVFTNIFIHNYLLYH